MKKLRQIFNDSQNKKNWKTYFHANDYKQKIIRKTKILKFQKTIDTNVANKKTLWHLIKWIKIKNHSSNELLKMFTLIKNMQKNIDEKLITFFKNKTWFLINKFFSASLSTDLSDISDATYLVLVHCPAVVTKKKVVKVMKKLKSNKTFELNDIINRFLKICENGLINVLTSFFQTCVNRKYYFKIY